MNIIRFHIYECDECLVSFAVEEAFEEQSAVNCPICCCDDHLGDIGFGEMIIRR